MMYDLNIIHGTIYDRTEAPRVLWPSMGSCLPIMKGGRERLIELMEGIENIPGAALSRPCNGRGYVPEYMSAFNAKPHTIDFKQVLYEPLRIFRDA